MTRSSDEPPRWADGASEAPEEVADLFREGRRDVATDAEMARVAERLGGLVGGSGVPSDLPAPRPSGSPPPAGLAVGKLSAGKLALVAGAAAVLLGAGLTWWALRSDPSVPAPRTKTPEPTGSQAPEPSEPRERAGPSETTSSGAMVASSEDGGEATRPKRQPRSRETTPGHVGRDRAPVRSKPSEIELLSRARRALAHNPAKALALAERHRRSFSDGSLAQEREVIAIDALMRLERRAKAERRAARFHARYPSSAHQRRVDSLVSRSP